MEAKFAYIRPNRDIAKLTWPKAAELLGHLSMVEWGDGCMRAEQLGMLPLAGASHAAAYCVWSATTGFDTK